MKDSDSIRACLASGRLLSAFAVTALAACAVGPNFRAPAPPETTRYTPDPQPKVTAAAPGPAGAAQTLVPDRDIPADWRSEEHTSELQSRVDLVCRLLLEKKKQNSHN